MIIKKGTKHPVTRSDKPNDNWTGDSNYFVIDDRTDLGKKILESAPYYEEVHNGSGVLVDIIPTEKPSLEHLPQLPTLEEQLAQLQSQLMTADERYKALDITTVSLEEIKTSKLAQLEELCEKSIVDGFDHTINDISYRFSCSINAQANFQGTDTLFKDGLITEAEWTVTNNVTGAIERIMLDQVTFNQIKLQVFTHINSNISKLRNTMQPQVESALTNDEIGLIVW